MYRIYDKEAAISEIQKYLHFISDRVYTDIPRVSIDGIYGSETANAVNEYQKLKGIPNDGVVDFKTFTELYESFKVSKFLMRSENFVIDEELLPLKLGDTGDHITLVNLVLNELRKTYKDIASVDIINYYTERTENAVLDLREIFMLPKSKQIDLQFYDRAQFEILVRSSENIIQNVVF